MASLSVTIRSLTEVFTVGLGVRVVGGRVRGFRVCQMCPYMGLALRLGL